MKARLAMGLLAAACSVANAHTASQAPVPRDAPAAAASQAVGTARISGVVVTEGATTRPVARAIVTLSGAGLRLNRNAITDSEGRFEMAALPAGRFSLSASKAGMLSVAYGATRPGRAGTPISVSDAQQVTVRLRLMPGAIITGVVRDEAGEPAPSLDVRVDRRDAAGSLMAAGAAVRTDDRGRYRIYGLPAGSYLVSARPRALTSALFVPTDDDIDAALRALQQRPSSVMPGVQPAARTTAPGSPKPPPVTTTAFAAPSGRALGVAPVYHPAAFSSDDATAVHVGIGDERDNVDITLRMVATSVVSGRLQPPAGRTSLTVTLTPMSNATGPRSTRTAADGTFEMSGVPPGRYVLASSVLSEAMTRISVGLAPADGAAAQPLDACLIASAEVFVDGQDVTGLSPSFRPCPRLAGSFVVTDTAVAAKPDLSALRITLQPLTTRTGLSAVRRVGPQVSADGAFMFGEFGEIRSGAYQIGLTSSQAAFPSTWRIGAVTVDGADVTDGAITFAPNSPDVIHVIVTLTDRWSSIGGQLQTVAGEPAVAYTIVAFTTDRTLWAAPFRRVVTTRPGTDGQFLFGGVPPGEYYVAALTDMEPADAQDATFLAELVAASARVVVRDGEHTVQDLRIRR